MYICICIYVYIYILYTWWIIMRTRRSAVQQDEANSMPINSSMHGGASSWPGALCRAASSRHARHQGSAQKSCCRPFVSWNVVHMWNVECCAHRICLHVLVFMLYRALTNWRIHSCLDQIMDQYASSRRCSSLCWPCYTIIITRLHVDRNHVVCSDTHLVSSEPGNNGTRTNTK